MFVCLCVCLFVCLFLTHENNGVYLSLKCQSYPVNLNRVQTAPSSESFCCLSRVALTPQNTHGHWSCGGRRESRGRSPQTGPSGPPSGGRFLCRSSHRGSTWPSPLFATCSVWSGRSTCRASGHWGLLARTVATHWLCGIARRALAADGSICFGTVGWTSGRSIVWWSGVRAACGRFRAIAWTGSGSRSVWFCWSGVWSACRCFRAGVWTGSGGRSVAWCWSGSRGRSVLWCWSGVWTGPRGQSGSGGRGGLLGGRLQGVWWPVLLPWTWRSLRSSRRGKPWWDRPSSAAVTATHISCVFRRAGPPLVVLGPLRGRPAVRGFPPPFLTFVIAHGDVGERLGLGRGALWRRARGSRVLLRGPVFASHAHDPLTRFHDEAAFRRGVEGAVDGRHQRVRASVLPTHHLLQYLPLGLHGVRGHPLGLRRPGRGPHPVPAGCRQGAAAGRGAFAGHAAAPGLARPGVRQLLVFHVQVGAGRGIVCLRWRGAGDEGDGCRQGRDGAAVDLRDDVDLRLDLLPLAGVAVSGSVPGPPLLLATSPSLLLLFLLLLLQGLHDLADLLGRLAHRAHQLTQAAKVEVKVVVVFVGGEAASCSGGRSAGGTLLAAGDAAPAAGPLRALHQPSLGQQATCLLYCSILFYSILFYSTLFYSIPFYSTLLYSSLLYSVLLCFIVFHSLLFYSILFYSVLFYSILLYSILFYFIQLYSILLCSVPFYSIPFYSTLLYSSLLYSILLCFILFHSLLFYSILFYSVLFYSILFYSILFYFTLFSSILFYFTLFNSILFYSILFYSVLFCSVLLYFILFYSVLF